MSDMVEISYGGDEPRSAEHWRSIPPEYAGRRFAWRLPGENREVLSPFPPVTRGTPAETTPEFIDYQRHHCERMPRLAGHPQPGRLRSWRPDGTYTEIRADGG